MPLVRIDIMEGRPPEKIRELHSRVAALVAEILDTPIERVRTYITQFPPVQDAVRPCRSTAWICRSPRPSSPASALPIANSGDRPRAIASSTAGPR